MMYLLTDEQIEKAVNWWVGAIRKPKFDGLSNEERADPKNDDYQMAEMMATLAVRPKTEQQLDAFKGALRDELLSSEYNPYHGLHVDYSPCIELHNAAEKAGIVGGMTFPWKTNMYFDDEGNVKVSAGYRAPMECL